MKKILSVILAAVLLCGMTALVASAENEPAVTLDKQYYDFNDGTFSIEVTFANLTDKTAWFGVYPASLTEITTADSHAFWCYANATLTTPAENPVNGTFTLSTSLCTDACARIKSDIDAGTTEFQVIMFYNDSDRVYEIAASAKFTFGEEPASGDDKPETPDNPETGSPVIAVIAAAAAVAVAGAVIVIKKVRA